MLKIVNFPDAILRERMPEFDFDNPSQNPKTLEKEMIETMFANNGMGLAANQVNQHVRMFVMGHKDIPEAAQAFFNPIVIASTEDVKLLEEACLSFPGIFVGVKRPSAIKARWQTSSGEFQEGEFRGYECKCFLHELDHLEGIVFQDRVSTLKWAMAVKKSKPKNKRK
jgi:peptide deformylase